MFKATIYSLVLALTLTCNLDATQEDLDTTNTWLNWQIYFAGEVTQKAAGLNAVQYAFFVIDMNYIQGHIADAKAELDKSQLDWDAGLIPSHEAYLTSAIQIIMEIEEDLMDLDAEVEELLTPPLP